MSKNKLVNWLILIFLLIGINSPAFAGTHSCGVIIGGKGLVPNIIEILKDLDASWLRINNHLDGNSGDIVRFLEAGFNVVITIDNHDPANMDKTYGSPQQFGGAGFPYKSKEVYQKRVQEVIKPLLPYLKKGKIMVQCENEIGDATINNKARFWRGTVEQYLTQLDAFYNTVKAIDSSIPVVLSSFTSEGLSRVIDPNKNDQMVKYATQHITTLLTKGTYDVADLHFYGCVEDIPAKVQWVKAHMPSGKLWISTENGGPDFRCSGTPMHYDEDPADYEQLQAKQVSQRLSACASNGGSVCLWFSLMDLKGEVEVFKHMGLLDFSGLEGMKSKFKGMMEKGSNKGPITLTPEQKEKFMQALRKKPAYQAFKSFVASER